MALVNIVDARASGFMAEDQSAATSSTPFDWTPLAQQIIDRGDTLFIPQRRRKDGRDIPYLIRELTPHSDGVAGPRAGATIVCESPRVVITANDPHAWIMKLEGAAEGLSITGGTWGVRSLGVLRQVRDANGVGSLNRAVFNRIVVTGCTRGFEAGSANGTAWRDCEFREISDIGIYLGKSADAPLDRGNIHSCSIERCLFREIGAQHGAGFAVGLDSDNHSRGRSKQCIRIDGCAFVDVDRAIDARGWLYGLSIENCLFAPAGRTGSADVVLVAHEVGSRSVMARCNVFATPRHDQRARVLLEGRVSCTMTDNTVHLHAGLDQRTPQFVATVGHLPQLWSSRNVLLHSELGSVPAEPASALGSPESD